MKRVSWSDVWLYWCVAFAIGVWSSGCSPPVPANAVHLPGGSAAASALWACWGMLERPITVYGVPDDCEDDSWGFTDPATGRCVGAFHDIGSAEVYLVTAPGALYSWSLPHELTHMVHGDGGHTRSDLWSDLNPESMEARGQACLRAQPDLDTI